jgi:hypothetical protein
MLADPGIGEGRKGFGDCGTLIRIFIKFIVSRRIGVNHGSGSGIPTLLEGFTVLFSLPRLQQLGARSHADRVQGGLGGGMTEGIIQGPERGRFGEFPGRRPIIGFGLHRDHFSA